MFLTKYSIYIKKYTFQPVDDEKRFNSTNSKFHILYRIFCYSGLIIAVTALVALVLINNNYSELNKLLKLDFNFILLLCFEIFKTTTFIFLIILSLLFYRFKADYRYKFIQKLALILSVFCVLTVTASLALYYGTTLKVLEPVLVTDFSTAPLLVYSKLNMALFLISVLLVSLYSLMYKRFSRKRTAINSNFYLGFYFILLSMLLHMLYTTSIQYLGFNDPDPLKLKLFTFSYGFSGFLLMYLIYLSFYSILFSIFIIKRKDKFIGSQFAVSYTLKLASLNFYSTMALFLISILPFTLLSYFKYF